MQLPSLIVRTAVRWSCRVAVIPVLLVPTVVLGQPEETDSVQHPESDYARLAEPATASSLKLTDDQQSQVTEILQQREAALAEASTEQRASVIEETDAKLAELLTDEQRELFESLYLKKLQFNFQYQKWADVLEWMAEESGLSLVMDAPPAGTFNYSDEKEYTPAEAIDLLNGWLQTKNYSLVRRDRLLMLLDLTEGVPQGVLPRVSVEELPTRGRFELVSVLIPLEGRPAEAAVAEIQPLLGRHGTVEPLPQTKQLLVTDTAGNLRAIQDVVKSLPVPEQPKSPTKAPDPVLTVYPLEHANPVKVGEVLEEMLSGTVVVDDAASQVTVNAVPAEQSRAKAIIDQLEMNQGPEKQPLLETYPAPRTNAAEITSTLQMIAPAAQVRINNESQQLQVWASPQDQQKVREALSKLGSSPEGGGQSQLEVYPVTNVTPQAAMTALTAVMPGIRVTVDAAGQRLIVVGTLSEHQAVARLIEQLQSPDDPELATAVKTYPLTKVDGNVTSLLSTLVPNAHISVDSQGTKLVAVASGDDQQRIASILEQLGAEDDSLKRTLVSYPLDRKLELGTVITLLSTVVPQAEVTQDASNHRLMIVATGDQHQTIASTIQEVAQDAGVDLPELAFYPLERVDGSRAVTILQSLAPAAQVTFDPSAKRLTVIAKPADQQTISDTLAKLEEVSSDSEERTLQIYAVTPTQKTRFASLASSLTAQLPGMQILGDAEPGELAVWAAPSEHAVVENILQQLDRELPAELTPKLVSYPIQKTDAASLNEVLTPLFPNVRITVDPKANRLLIWARPAEHETLKQALTALDTDAPVETEFKLMVYPVEGVTPEVGAQMIQAELPGVTVITDPTAKTLLVRARVREHERIASMLDAINASELGTHERSVVVYPAIPGDPNEVYNFFARSIPSASVLVDRTTGRMSVWATAKEHEQISHAVADMIGTGEGGLKATLKTYTVENAPPGTVTSLVSQAAPTAKLAMSDDGRQLLAWARAADHELIQEVVSGLAKGPDGTAKGSVAVFDVEKIGTTAARNVLTPIAPGVTFADSPDGNALLAWVSDKDRQRITTALEQVLSDDVLSGERRLKIYDLTDVGGQEAQQVLTSTMPSVSFPSSDGGKTVVVWARPRDHEQIEATISQLSETQPFQDDRTLEIYSIRNLGPNVTTMLSTLVPEAQISSGPQSTEIAVTASPENQKEVAEIIGRLKESSRPRYKTIGAYDLGRADPEAVRQTLQPLVDADVQITVDPQSRRVFVRTYSDTLKDIEAIIERITQQPGADGELATRTYQLTRGEADEAQQVLQALLPGATLVTDNDNRVLAATATVEQHQLIEQVVSQMQGAFGTDGGPVPATYPLKTADPEATVRALQNLFARSPEVSLSVDRPARMLVAIASPEQHETIRQLVQQLDQAGEDDRHRTVAVYGMRGTDRNSAVAVVEKLLEGIDPDAKVAYNQQTRQLIVTTLPEGHARVSEMADQLGSTEERDVEVFQLERMEPFTAQLAIDGIFADGATDPADLPSIRTNEESQQLIVRGTTEQIQQIREILVKMGEAALGDRSASTRNVRVIPIDGSVEQALPRIEQLWPRLRTNPLRVLRPGDRIPAPQTPETESGSPQSLLQPKNNAGVQPVAYVSDVREGDQDMQPPAAADPSTPSPPAEDAGEQDSTEQQAPVVIIPGQGRVTVFSEDPEALDQMESLLRSLFSRRDTLRGRDFTIYPLQNASAVTVAETINEFFRRRSPLSSDNVMIVPDYRLNSLIVYAGRADRERIEGLIQTLDSENIPASLAAFQTRIVPVEHADAADVAQTLQGIFKVQMTAGGARQSVSIPEGVPSSIASVLRQISAAASSPLLTIEVDETTNSLVLMAPQNLLDEVSALINELDEAAAHSQARLLRIIPLRKTRSEHVIELLQRITE